MVQEVSKMLHIKAFMEKNRPTLALLPKVLLVVLAFTLMIVTSCLYVSRMLYAYLERDALDVLTRTKLQIESELSTPATTLNLVSETVRSMLINESSEEKITEYLRNINLYMAQDSNESSLSYDGIYGHFDGFGENALLEQLPQLPEGFNSVERPWYKAAVDAGSDMAITLPYKSALDNITVITYSRRIFDDAGNPLGVLCVDLPLANIDRYMQAINITKDSYGILLNEKWECFLHVLPYMVGKNALEMSSRFNGIANELQAGNGPVQYEAANLAGTMIICFVSRLDNGWILSIEVPKVQYFHELTNMQIVIGILGAVLAALLIAILMRLEHQRNKATAAAAAEAQEADAYANLMMEATPLGCFLWKDDYTILDCNQETTRLLKLPDRSVFLNNFFSMSPKYQPCGRASDEMTRAMLETAFKEGYCYEKWIHQAIDGERIPCEVILVRVKHRGEYLVAAYIRDMRKITATMNAMHKAETDLRMALAIAEDSAHAKGEFLDNMSHELRTPMNGILGFLHIALQHELSDIQRDNIQKADESARSLLKIIDRVLDFNDLEHSSVKVDAAPFRLSEVFDALSEVYAIPAKKKGLALNLHLPAALPAVMIGDAPKLMEVLSNLVDNAIKFTEKGKITVRAKVNWQKCSQVEVAFYVRDSGIGMTPDQQKVLFTPFSQANTSLTRQYGGTGLGLALAKQLVHLLGGKIWAESEYQKGSTFHFRVRFKLPDISDAEPLEAGSVKIFTEEPAVSIPVLAPGDIQVLLVDDVEINQIIGEEILKEMGYNVDIASNGQEAIDMLAEKPYNIVFMDIQMPVLDGLAATQKIRENTAYKDLPIIALSAHIMPEDKEKSLDSGMNDHITKPIDPAILTETISKWLSAA
jgi:signal transduction histidine kinase